MFLGLLFRFMKSKLHYRALENQYGRFYSKKYRKFEIFFFLFFLFKWIKHIDLFQTIDKGGKNSCSLWKIFFGPAPYVWLINYVQTSSSICNDLINSGFNIALGELGKYRVFPRLSLMKILEPLLNSIF